MRDEQDSKNLVGHKASFIVRVTSRQNATWQGSISWTERGVTKHFRRCKNPFLTKLKFIDVGIINKIDPPVKCQYCSQK